MEQAQGPALLGKKLAVLMTDGVEQIEYPGPRQFLEGHGARAALVSPKPKGEAIQGFDHLSPGDRFPAELNIRDASPEADEEFHGPEASLAGKASR